MALHRKLRALLVGCVLFGVVVSAWAPCAAAQSRPSKRANSPAGTAGVKTAARRGCRTIPAARRGGAVRRRSGQGSLGRAGDRRRDGRSLIFPQCRRIFHAGFQCEIVYHGSRTRHAWPGLSRADHRGVKRRDRCERLVERRPRSDRPRATRISPTGNFLSSKKEEREGPPEKVFAEFADAVAARGVKEVTGDVIADDSMFQHEKFPSGWLVDDILWSYGAAVSAIAFNDNTFSLNCVLAFNEGEPAQYDAGLAADFYTVENLMSHQRARQRGKIGGGARSRLASDSTERHDAARRADPAGSISPSRSLPSTLPASFGAASRGPGSKIDGTSARPPRAETAG